MPINTVHHVHLFPLECWKVIHYCWTIDGWERFGIDHVDHSIGISSDEYKRSTHWSTKHLPPNVRTWTAPSVKMERRISERARKFSDIETFCSCMLPSSSGAIRAFVKNLMDSNGNGREKGGWCKLKPRKRFSRRITQRLIGKIVMKISTNSYAFCSFVLNYNIWLKWLLLTIL